MDFIGRYKILTRKIFKVREIIGRLGFEGMHFDIHNLFGIHRFDIMVITHIFWIKFFNRNIRECSKRTAKLNAFFDLTNAAHCVRLLCCDSFSFFNNIANIGILFGAKHNSIKCDALIGVNETVADINRLNVVTWQFTVNRSCIAP